MELVDILWNYYILISWYFKTVFDPYSAIEATELRGILLKNEIRLLYKQQRRQKNKKKKHVKKLDLWFKSTSNTLSSSNANSPRIFKMKFPES